MNVTEITQMRANGDSWRTIGEYLECKPVEIWKFYQKATQKPPKQSKKLEFTLEVIKRLREDEHLTWREISKRIGVKMPKIKSYYYSDLTKQNLPPIIKKLAFRGNQITPKYPPRHLWGIQLLQNDGYSFREIGRYFGDKPTTIENWYHNHIDNLTVIPHPSDADEYDFDLVSIMRAMRWSWKKIISFHNTTNGIKTWYNSELSEFNGKVLKNSIETSHGTFNAIRVDKSFLCSCGCGGRVSAGNKHLKGHNNPPKNSIETKNPKCLFCGEKISKGERYCSDECEIMGLIRMNVKKERITKKLREIKAKISKSTGKALEKTDRALGKVIPSSTIKISLTMLKKSQQRTDEGLEIIGRAVK